MMETMVEVRQREYGRESVRIIAYQGSSTAGDSQSILRFIYLLFKKRVIYLHIEDPWYRAVKANQPRNQSRRGDQHNWSCKGQALTWGAFLALSCRAIRRPADVAPRCRRT